MGNVYILGLGPLNCGGPYFSPVSIPLICSSALVAHLKITFYSEIGSMNSLFKYFFNVLICQVNCTY